MSSPLQKVKRITEASFRPYGRVIELKERRREGNLFKVILRQRHRGWRIAYLVVRDRKIGRLEQHPKSHESFEPVRGRGLLFVSRSEKAREIACFLLDKPVILSRGIWHGVIALSNEFDVKITENASVRCLFWHLGSLLRPQKGGLWTLR